METEKRRPTEAEAMLERIAAAQKAVAIAESKWKSLDEQARRAHDDLMSKRRSLNAILAEASNPTPLLSWAAGSLAGSPGEDEPASPSSSGLPADQPDAPADVVAGRWRMCPSKTFPPSAENLAAARAALEALPYWWGQKSDLTAREERFWAGHRCQGVAPNAAGDHSILAQVLAWRARVEAGDTEPRWGEWCEFTIDLGEEGKVACLSRPSPVFGLRPAGHSMCFYGVATGPDVYSWHPTQMLPVEGELLLAYAERVALHLAERRARAAAKPKQARKRKGQTEKEASGN